MTSLRTGRKGLVAAFAAVLGMGAVFAAQAAIQIETTLTVRTESGATEEVRFEGDLAPGEQRALTTQAGNPASIVRTETGLSLQLASERFDVPMPQIGSDGEVDAAALDALRGEGKRVIVIDKDASVHIDGAKADGSREQRTIVRMVKRPAADDATQVERDAPGPELLTLVQGGDKAPRVIVSRRIVHTDTSAPQG
jgi:hypothetical protein